MTYATKHSEEYYGHDTHHDESGKSLFDVVEEVDVVMASMPEADFTNILHEPFTCKDPKSAKKVQLLDSIFCAYGICEQKNVS